MNYNASCSHVSQLNLQTSVGKVAHSQSQHSVSAPLNTNIPTNDVTRSLNDVIKVEPPDEWTEYSSSARSLGCDVNEDAMFQPPGSVESGLEKVSEVETFSDSSDCEGSSVFNKEAMDPRPDSVSSREQETGVDESVSGNKEFLCGVSIKCEPIDTFSESMEFGKSEAIKAEIQPDSSSTCSYNENMVQSPLKAEPTSHDENSYDEDSSISSINQTMEYGNDTATPQPASTEIDFAEDETYRNQIHVQDTSSEQPKGMFDDATFTYDDVDSKPHACTQCDKRFNKAKFLRHHLRMHTGERPYSCQECDKSFTRYSTLQNHKQTHMEGTPFACTICEKQFKQSRHLQQHLRTHESDMPLAVTAPTEPGCAYVPLRKPPKPRPFTCPICGKDFVRSFHLQRHTRSHTGERPFSCPTCGKSFRDTTCLHRHQRSHTGERPFKCDVCGERFMLSCHLQGHMMIHTGERPFSCPTCKKDFLRAFDLQRHKMTHTGEKPYSCSLCGTLFSRSSALHRHLRRHTCPAPDRPGQELEGDGKDDSEEGADGDEPTMDEDADGEVETNETNVMTESSFVADTCKTTT